MNTSGDYVRKYMGNLASYFKTKLNDDQKYLYQKSLSIIPIIAFEDIANGIIEERRPTPGGFPTINEIKERWWIWQKMNPDRVEKNQTQERLCDECNSSGVLIFKGPIPISEFGVPMYNFKPTISAICAGCNNWKRHLGNIDGLIRYSKKYILDKGWEMWPFLNNRRVNIKTKQDLIDSVGEKIKGVPVDYSDPKFNARRDHLRQQAETLTKQNNDIPF